MPESRCRIFVIICSYFLSTHASCIKTHSSNNSSVSQIFSENFFSGQAFPSSVNCSLVIRPPSSKPANGYFIFTSRVIESKIDRLPRELLLSSGDVSTLLTGQSRRVFKFAGSEPVEIVYRTGKSSGFSIDRFLLEWTFVDREENSCPAEWKCNCDNQCPNARYTCPYCSLGTDDHCRSDEIWCLPASNNRSDQRGFCVSRDEPIACAQSTRTIQCDRTIPQFDQDRTVTEENLILGESLCLVLHPRSPVDLRIHQKLDVDVTRHQSMIVRLVKLSDAARLNLTWSVRSCPFGQFMCSDQGERRCYSPSQRCDGRWDCSNGDDEFGCSLYCPSGFACHDSHRPTCFFPSDRCNGYPTCSSHFDEELCSPAQCNANNGSFLCRNRRCIYEAWRCDGTNDCGDNSDEEFCAFRPHRRVITAAVTGVVICSIIFLFVLSCSCKLFSVRRSFRLFHRSASSSNDEQPVAPPSYNQTVGLTDDQDERLALLVDHLRLAGFAEVMNISQTSPHGHPLLNRESPPAYAPSEQTHPSSDTDDEKLLIP